jgi:hypothetical protein
MLLNLNAAFRMFCNIPWRVAARTTWNARLATLGFLNQIQAFEGLSVCTFCSWAAFWVFSNVTWGVAA